MSEHDRNVLEASKALDAANAGGDAQKIRAAIARLEGALRGEAPPPPPKADGPSVGATEVVAPGQAAAEFSESAEQAPSPSDAEALPGMPADAAAAPAASADLVAPADGADASARTDGAAHDAGEAAAVVEAPAAAPKAPPKPVVAMRGDDRPSSKKAEAAPARGVAGGRFGDRRDGGRPGAGGPGRPGGDRGDRGAPRGGDRGAPGGRFGDRPPREDRGPRLGDAAFRAQREALERADLALRKLAAQAHGEALTQVLGAWEQRDASRLPSVQELGRAVTPAVRSGWSQAIGSAPTAAANDAAEALLRLEMAAEVPTPAEQLDARRALQLKLLTKRGDPAPSQTWGQDAGKVLAAAHDAASARRLQNALKALLRK
ncbi:hypothetical protein QMO14_31875 [Variovorax sp. CAN2819]|uniref:hypothetical protein n=1 Tax=Variovorax sp. CAN15 TaxID=3046727 RepID=UPI002647D22A|nr:hypothetical protein [Variovorax sp. CAN15]MDN6888181.1 hypothetical protein [Variovorax sp. CAN15]